MTTFSETWLVSSAGTYLDDVLWPAVVAGSGARGYHGDATAQAAWRAYCDYALDEDADLTKLIAFIRAAEIADIPAEDIYPLVEDHRGLGDMIDAVNEAIDGEEDTEDDEDMAGSGP